MKPYSTYPIWWLLKWLIEYDSLNFILPTLSNDSSMFMNHHLNLMSHPRSWQSPIFKIRKSLINHIVFKLYNVHIFKLQEHMSCVVNYLKTLQVLLGLCSHIWCIYNWTYDPHRHLTLCGMTCLLEEGINNNNIHTCNHLRQIWCRFWDLITSQLFIWIMFSSFS